MNKVIEYYCNKCSATVCSKCMFHHHNGHELLTLDEALKNIVNRLREFNLSVEEAEKLLGEVDVTLNKSKSDLENAKNA